MDKTCISPAFTLFLTIFNAVVLLRKMTEICIWLDKVLEWVDRCGAPTIPYIGLARFGFRNLPAPHLEFACFLDKGIKDVAIGDQVVSIPPYHLAIHNVHQGNYTPAIQRTSAWCLFLDVSGEQAFAELETRPLSCKAALPFNKEVIAAYERLAGLCVRYGMGSLAYHEAGAAYDPSRSRSVSPMVAIRIKAALLDLLALLRQLYTTGEETSNHPPAIQHAIEFMSLQYRDPDIRLPDLSRAAGLSTDHFGRLFRQHLHESPMHYLRRIRINQASYALEHTNLYVEEIAFDVGFTDALHFSRVFRSVMKTSPTVWRKTIRDQN